MSSKNHEASSMFLEPDPVPQGNEVNEWRPGVASERPETNHNHEAGQSFGFYHPATTQRGGCYAE